ncbi:MAG: class I tRNA ligase family protein [Candidatus Shikimatogenerans sp. AspAUS03]|uniref:valine--tRNA ligase n=1 Tax=Candidatus Shikimatogenerans sp. AspAUS03 TaxID=3158563 RepID=A0AAU7QSM3_9FLAO
MKFLFSLKEKEIFNIWKRLNIYFLKKKYKNKNKIYSVTIPPPNITGNLHIGHVLNVVLQDILVRYKIMLNYNVSWIIGTDHASIATESKIRSIYKSKNKKYILNKIKEWSKKYQNIIIKQLINLGCLFNYKNIEFTLNNKFKLSIKKIFKIFLKKKYIYKKYKFINWDYNLNTSLSKEEIKKKRILGYMYYIKYRLYNSNIYIVIATSKPETLFGDIFLCINDNNKYYNFLKNKKIYIPIINKIIKIIINKYVKNNFGTNIMRITPYYDKNDYKISKNYNYKIIKLITKNGVFNKNSYFLKNYYILNGKKKIINNLLYINKIISIKLYNYNIYYSDKYNYLIYKILSLQLFLNLKKMSKKVLYIINTIQIYPKNYKIEILKWLNNIKDWNISRNLIWGHKIYNNINNKKYKILDTWFSSCLWPSIIFNGINKPFNKRFKKYYPLDILFTGKDILFCWIVRMLILNIFLTKKSPFKKIFFTGLIKNKNNIKISKSLNNYISLNKIIKKYNIDIIRLGVIINYNYNKDIIINNIFFLKSKKFIKKIKNIYKYFLVLKFRKNKININYDLKIINIFYNIFNKLIYKNYCYIKKNNIIKSINLIFHYFKFYFCNYFIEYVKKINYKFNINYILYKYFYIFYKIFLQLLHPYIPFITDYIYIKIRKHLYKLKYKKKYLLKYKMKILINNIYPIIKYIKNSDQLILIKIIQKINILKIKYKFNKFDFIFYKKNKYIKLLKCFFKVNMIKYKFYKYNVNYIIPFFIKNIYFLLSVKKKINYNLSYDINYIKKYIFYLNNKINNKFYLLNVPSQKIKCEKDKIKRLKQKLFFLKKL